MPRAYSMRGVQGVAHQATLLARSYLAWVEPSGRVHDVQDDPRFQHRGVDLLWERPGAPVLGLEVKGDRNDRRGNFFFEVVSNLEKDTPGCFLYSTAALYLYAYVAPRELHVLPLGPTRAWYLSHSSEFPLKQTRTRLGPFGYTTVGAAVPVRRVLSEVEGAKRFRLDPEGSWHERPVRALRRAG